MGFSHGYGQVPDAGYAEEAIREVFGYGCNFFDTAEVYGKGLYYPGHNEEIVGRAVKGFRNEAVIATKLHIQPETVEDCGSVYAAVRRHLERSLKNLQTDYVDLLLIHQPFGDYYGTWRAMEATYKAGKARAIGVSNFYPDRFIDLAEHVEIKPMVNQVETHVFNQQRKAQEIMERYGTRIMSWGPFAEGRNNLFTNPVLVGIGKKYGKSSAQVALRYLIQRDVIVIPKSTHIERMRQNMEVFDFALADDDMAAIAALDGGKSLFFSHYDPEFVNYLLTFKAD